MMLLGQVIYRREADDAVMLYAGEVDGWDMARIVTEGREFEPHTLFALLARGGWEPTSAVPVEQDDEVVKHFQGTEHDHDQSSHAGGRGKGYTRPDTTNTAAGDRLFDDVEAILVRNHRAADALSLRTIDRHYGEGGLYGAVKDRNALDIGDRLIKMGANPDDLLALVMNQNALQSAGPGVSADLTDSAAVVGEYVSSVDWSASPESSSAYQERLEVMRRNWANLAEMMSGDGLPEGVGVVAVQLSDGRFSVRLTRDPKQEVADGRANVILQENGEWSPDAARYLGYVAVDTMQRSWAQSSTGRNADVIAAAVAEELGMTFGMAQTPAWGHWSSIDRETEPFYRAEGRVHDARKAIVRAMYENTQEQLKTLFSGKDSFVLYRGAAFNDLGNEMESSIIAGTSMDVTDRMERAEGQESMMAMYRRDHKPLSSWTSKPSTADSFVMDETEFVATAVVPRERIFSTAFTGLGAFNESEFVVLGGKMPIAVRSSEDAEVQRVSETYLRARLANESLDADEFITINGQVIPLFKHLQGTEFDHDQSRHAGSRSIAATGGRADIVKVTDTTYRYDYGDFNITTNITGRQLLEDTRLEGTYYSVDEPPSAIEDLGEVALDSQWNQWEGNFVMRHLSAAMMGLPHQYASGGEGYNEDIQNAIVYGERSDNEMANETAEELLRDHAPTTHAMLQAIADGTQTFAEPWEGIVRRAMVVNAGRDGSHPLLRLYEGDSLDLALSAFSPSVDLTDRFLRGGAQGRDVLQSDEDFVFSPDWRSVMFEMDTAGARTLAPAGWQSLAESSEMWVHTSYEDRAADADDGEEFRKQPAPWEVVTQGKFRVTRVRSEERRFREVWAESDEPMKTEDMRVITIQQTAVYNPRTNTYDALPGFVTLPDGRVIPVEEAA